MKILYVLDHFYPHIGGAETLFFNLLKVFSKDKNVEIKILTSNSGGINGERIINKNYIVSYQKWWSLFGHPIPNLINLWREMRNADIIHTSTYTTGFFAFLVNLFVGKKIVLTVYENLFLKWFHIDNIFNSIIFFIFEFFSIHLPFDFYIAISKNTKKDLIKSGIKEEKIMVIYPFLSKTNTIKKPKLDIDLVDNKKYFLYFGRPGKTKGIFILLHAIKMLPESFFKKFYFIFVLSNDPLSEKLKILKFIKKNKLREKIKIFKPFKKEELNFVIKRSFCVIIPSITEGFGFTAYESIQFRKPVIVSNVGSLREIVSGKFLFFNNRDSFDLSNKIIEASLNRFKYKKIFTIDGEKEIRKLKFIYNKLIKDSN